MNRFGRVTQKFGISPSTNLRRIHFKAIRGYDAIEANPRLNPVPVYDFLQQLILEK